MRCHTCGGELPEGSVVCPRCREAMQDAGETPVDDARAEDAEELEVSEIEIDGIMFTMDPVNGLKRKKAPSSKTEPSEA